MPRLRLSLHELHLEEMMIAVDRLAMVFPRHCRRRESIATGAHPLVVADLQLLEG